jgi:hypothetical protein
MGTVLAWAVVGYAVAALLKLPRRHTVILTVAAAVLGLGAGILRAARPHLAALAVAATVTEALAIIALAATAGVLIAGRRRRKHGSAAIASTRYVLYTEPETQARRTRKGTRNARR